MGLPLCASRSFGSMILRLTVRVIVITISTRKRYATSGLVVGDSESRIVARPTAITMIEVNTVLKIAGVSLNKLGSILLSYARNRISRKNSSRMYHPHTDRDEALVSCGLHTVRPTLRSLLYVTASCDGCSNNARIWITICGMVNRSTTLPSWKLVTLDRSGPLDNECLLALPPRHEILSPICDTLVRPEKNFRHIMDDQCLGPLLSLSLSMAMVRRGLITTLIRHSRPIITA
mmetsp:Transcript_33688/g.67975  ORF Transcript_33688/g.67975 Transcript_33688/m.67975 type:complete len:233 (-) Transcript_33688:793-1491(-)